MEGSTCGDSLQRSTLRGRSDLREVAYIAILAVLMCAGPAGAQTGTEEAVTAKGTPAQVDAPDEPASSERAREKLSDLLFGESIDRIDLQATT